MQGGQTSCAVVFEHNKTAALPIAERTHYFLLGMVELIRHIGNAGGPAGIHHAQKIQIHFQLRVIGVSHIIVDKYIGYKGSPHSVFAIDREHFTNLPFPCRTGPG